MMKTVIVDDDPIARKALGTMLLESGNAVDIVGEAGTINEAIACIQTQQPDLVMLDIRLKHGTGFDILKEVNTAHLAVIFTTAYSEYAIKAIQHAAIDYLLKPIDPDELKAALQRTEQRKHAHTRERLALLEAILQNKSTVGSASTTPLKIALGDAHGFKIVEVSTILWCEGEKNYTTFHLTGGQKITTSQTLMTYEKMLSGSSILRIHKSHLVNVDQVKEYIKGRGGQVVLSNGQTLTVSRDKKDVLLNKLNASLH